MATTAITPTELVLGTESADILDANGTAADTPADGWVVTPGDGNPFLLFKFLVDGTGDTITFVAGDDPPSKRAGLGNKTITMAASDVRYICVEPARFLQSDGTYLITCVDAGTTIRVFALPKGYLGGSPVTGA